MPLSTATGSATAAVEAQDGPGGRVSLDDQPLRGVDGETWPRGCAGLLILQIGPRLEPGPSSESGRACFMARG